jgi:tetratricopeptide (TPR) repeat protein
MFARVTGVIVLVCVAAWAVPDDWEREVHGVRTRLDEIRAKAEALHGDGKYEEARRHAGQFIELSQHMAHRELLPLAERLDKQGKKDAAHRVRSEAEKILHQAEEVAAHVREFDRQRKHPEEIVEGLKAGVRALVALGRHEEAEHLERIAAEVERRARHRNKELEIVERRIEVYRLAHHAFREAEKRDAAEAVERIIHAFELALEGRNDEEARRIREKAPKLGQRVELLLHAGKLWDEFGHERKAKRCFELGEELKEQWQREKRGKGQGLERAMERIEQLEKRLERIEGYLKKLTER